MSIKKRGKFTALIRSSKSQAAIFIIIAMVVILSGVVYFFYQRQIFQNIVEVVQPEALPVKVYIEDCIKNVAQDGLERIGLGGGYISVPEKIKSDPRAYLATFPAGGFKMPYWWHDSIEAVPTEDFINQQLASHIESELKSCINDFEPFSGRFEINELKKPIAEVKFNENDVSVELDYHVEVIAKEGNFKALLERFGYTLPIRFKKVYETAKLIMERENKDYFIERKAIDLMSMDVDIPTTDVEAGCSPKTWQLSSIKEKLKNLLRINLPYIRVKGTDYNPNLYVPNPAGRNIYSDTYFQHHYIWEIDRDSRKYSNMKVSFAYEDWPMNIYARPSENGILRSNAQKGTDKLTFFCLQIWHFTYDINFPVVVSIFDQETESNKPYQFNFAFKASIDHNQPNRVRTGTTLFDIPPDLSQDDYCSNVQNEVTIFTVDNSTGDDIKGVNLTFVCGRYYCGMGQSDWLSLGAAAGITRLFPYCVYGIVKGSREGFGDAASFIQTDVDGRSYVLALNPVKEFNNYIVVKHPLSNPSVSSSLAPNEKASISIKGKDFGFESFAAYPQESQFPLKIADRDASYDVEVYVTDEESIVAGYIGELKASKSALSNANEIVFHVIEHGYSSEDEMLLFVSGLSSYSKNVPAPELK